MKRISCALLCAIILFVSGCGPKAEKQKEIVMWLVGSETQAHAVNRIGKDFQDKTGVSVRCQAVSWPEAHSKYLTSIAGGVTPDIATMGLTWGSEFGNLGAMVNLKEAFPEDVLSIKKRIFPGIWDSVERKGRLFGIPFDMTEHILYYRSDIIDRPPATWDALTSLLEELKKENKGMLFDWGSLNWIGYSIYLWQAGGDYFDADYTRCALNTDEAVRGMEYFARLYNELGVPKTEIPVEQGMRTGDFPLAISGNWKIVELTVSAPEIEGKWSIATLPEGPSGRKAAFIGGRIMGILSDSEMKEESWEFIKFLFEPKNQVRLYDEAWKAQDAYLPPNMNAWEFLPMRRNFREVLKAQALDAKGPPPVPGWDASTRFVDEAVQKVILTNKDARAALERATERIDWELEKHKR